MNTTSPTPVVVVTEEKKRRKGLLWVAGGAALLLGGSTFALWSASSSFTGGTVTAGDLNIVQAADTSFWDVSADRVDATGTVTGTDGSQKGHAITSVADWRIVPGDKVAASFSADVTLEGDNLVGKLTLDGAEANTLANTGMTYTYEIYKEDTLVVAEKALPTTAGASLLYLSAPATGQAAGAEDANGTTVYSMANTTEDFTVVVYGTFDAATATRDQVTVADTLANLTVKLEQVRDTGAQFVVPTPAP
ncbi:alternate-type signal peptide domain-containing protein [Cellulomonas sp. NPDC089187]|uniref:alternate-type signal peptide domain-containing protein n=1 Tax=Cellulomonas sp. NPDC089187 TaxID=3154970 RepID=UPI0034472CCD